MDASSAVLEMLDGRSPREIVPGLYSVLPEDDAGQRYDGRARAYDRMIGNRLYNRILWGTTPAEYRAFARKAVASTDSGWLLDGGCGTLLLTAEAYAAAPARPVIAVDRSVGMLRRARERLHEVSGGRARHVAFLQADLLDLPFRTPRFSTILCMGMLHLFDSVQPLLANFAGCLRPSGRIFLNSLVENDRFGDHYLRFLHRAGEVAAPRENRDFEARLRSALPGLDEYRVSGNMAYVTARASEWNPSGTNH